MQRLAMFRPATVCFILSLLGAGATPGGDDYPTLLRRAREMDPSLDFAALRLAYSASPGYAPYEPSSHAHRLRTVRDALNEEKFGEAVEPCEASVGEYFFDPKMHVLCSYANSRAGNDGASAMHEFAADGLLASVRSSGDGRSPETAYEVVTIAEEYALLWVDGQLLMEQGLMRHEGHSYDRM